MGRAPNVWIKELCGVKKGLDESSDECMLRWFAPDLDEMPQLYEAFEG